MEMPILMVIAKYIFYTMVVVFVLSVIFALIEWLLLPVVVAGWIIGGIVCMCMKIADKLREFKDKREIRRERKGFEYESEGEKNEEEHV